MKKLRKVFAVILSLAMVLGMSLTSFAAEYATGTEEETVTITNLENGDIVSFYKIVEPKMENGVFENYKIVDTYKGMISEKSKPITPPTAPTADETAAIAKKIATDGIEANANVTVGANGIASKSLPIGTYVALVKAKSATTIYNPMIVSVYYTVDGVAVDSLDADSQYQIEGTDAAYAKKATPTLEKVITNYGANGNKKGDDLAIGDTAKFQITTDIPSYSNEYENVVYRITDTLDGLHRLSNLKVYLNSVAEENVIDAKNYTITDLDQKQQITIPENTEGITDDGITSFSINFKSDYIKSFSSTLNQKIVVTYDAVLSNEAKLNYDKHTNTAHFIYTNKPGNAEGGNTNDVEDKTYHYTFGIDAKIGGTENWLTSELLKTGEDVVTGSGSNKKEGLPGAKFKLTNTDTNKVYETVSDDDGAISFKGLDAGNYTLVETEAPKGYSLNKTVIPVKIDAKYKENGELESYSITVGGTTVDDGTRKTTYTMGENEKVTTTVTTTDKKGEVTTTEFPNKFVSDKYQTKGDNVHDTSNTYEIVNTTLASLPSTGGIGTTIFTIGGCIIMVAAAALFFASRRKSAK